MAQTLISTQNLTAQPQKCFWNGRIYVIQPYQVREFIDDIAYAFFEQRSGFVVEYKPVELPEPGPRDKLVWVANNTGNPFLPEKVQLKRFRKGEEELYEVDNPLREAVVIRREMSRGQRFEPSKQDPGALESFSLGNQKIVIPPFTRVCIAEPVAEWLMRRDGMQEKHHRGKLVRSREPSDCEPNVSWSLTELQVYAGILEVGEELLGPHEDELKAKYRTDPETCELETLRAKQDLLYVLFFRLIDERFWQPSQSEFAQYLKQAETQALGVQLEDKPPDIPQVAEQAPVKATPTRKKRGRPPRKKEAEVSG